MLKLDHKDFCMSYEKLLAEKYQQQPQQQPPQHHPHGSYDMNLMSLTFQTTTTSPRTLTTSTQPSPTHSLNGGPLFHLSNPDNNYYPLTTSTMTNEDDHSQLHSSSTQTKNAFRYITTTSKYSVSPPHDIDPINSSRNIDPTLNLDFQDQVGSKVQPQNHDLMMNDTCFVQDEGCWFSIHEPSFTNCEQSFQLELDHSGRNTSSALQPSQVPPTLDPSSTITLMNVGSEEISSSSMTEISSTTTSTLPTTPTLSTSCKKQKRSNTTTSTTTTKGKGICKRSRSSSSLSASKIKQQSMQFTFPLWTFHVSRSSNSSRH